VKVTDDKHLRITFSEAIDTDTIVLKITKQSDNSTIKTDAISGVADMPESVDVTLDDTLVEASSYTLTVIAGIGKSGATITDGASALQDFITPSPLKVSPEEGQLNAPPNPNAVMTNTSTVLPNTQADTKPTPVMEEIEPVATEELPLTGPSTFLFLSLALILAYVAIQGRKSL
jgi:hypothetical protein